MAFICKAEGHVAGLEGSPSQSHTQPAALSPPLFQEWELQRELYHWLHLPALLRGGPRGVRLPEECAGPHATGKARGPQRDDALPCGEPRGSTPYLSRFGKANPYGYSETIKNIQTVLWFHLSHTKYHQLQKFFVGCGIWIIGCWKAANFHIISDTS